jgi:hypothetical protein
MGLVQAQLAFHHDAVGSKAQNEVFEVQNEQVCAELEQKGYVKKVEGSEAQLHQEQAKLQQQVGEVNKLTNEAVSMASHDHNQQANQQAQQAQQIRQQLAQQAQQGQNQQAQQSSETHIKTTTKKANEK